MLFNLNLGDYIGAGHHYYQHFTLETEAPIEKVKSAIKKIEKEHTLCVKYEDCDLLDSEIELLETLGYPGDIEQEFFDQPVKCLANIIAFLLNVEGLEVKIVELEQVYSSIGYGCYD